MHFVGTKKKRLFNPVVQLKELPLLNRNKKELITTACEQLSSTEGAPTVTRSLVSLRSSFDLELTARREILRKPDFLSCLKNLTQKRKEDRTQSFRRLNCTFIPRLELDFNVFGSCLEPAFTPLSPFISGTSTCTCNIEFHFQESLRCCASNWNPYAKAQAFGILAPGLAHIHIGHS